MTHAREEHLPERTAFLVLLATGPTIWFAHFLATYTTVAVACGPRGPGGEALGTARWLVAVYTVAALAAIAVVGWSGWRRHRFGTETVPHDMDTPGDRHRFLGFATFLLALLSAMATLFVATAVSFFEGCR